MAAAMSIKKGGESSSARDKLISIIVAERMTDIIAPHYVTEAMQWGIDNQDKAIAEYEILKGVLVSPEAFYWHREIEYFGATPDGIYRDGSELVVIEIKCLTTANHIRLVKNDSFPPEFIPQVTTEIICARADRADLVLYDPRIKGKKRMRVYSITKDQCPVSDVEDAARVFLNEVENLFTVMTEA